MPDLEPVFGKNVIETLSEGMYRNPMFLFREYVQNSADAIEAARRQGILEQDEGEINITINAKKRVIIFEDSGTGIPSKEVIRQLGNIGDSTKDRITNMGFRGIGRLGGLGYCHLVRFETSYLGEDTETILEWDAKLLHSILADNSNRCSAESLIKDITKITSKKCEKNRHFFRVSLIDVISYGDMLLNEDEVYNYLSMVAPVPFDYAKFPFVEKIEQFLSEKGLQKPNEYVIYLNGNEIRKGYENPIKLGNGNTCRLIDVQCKVIESNDKPIGWLWYGLTLFEGFLPKSCWQRSIRLRKSNIQIGEDDCLSNTQRGKNALWKEDRGNHYFIGEVHALDNDLIPNSRRDYFNPNDACSRFEKELSAIFYNLFDVCRDVSKIRSSIKKIDDASRAITEFKKRSNNNEFSTSEEYKSKKKEAEKLQATISQEQNKIEKVYKNASSEDLKIVTNEYVEPVLNAYETVSITESTPVSKKTKFIESTISQDIMSVLNKVFGVLETILEHDEYEEAKAAIFRQFKK